MKRLMPGVYDDERGGLHINVGELLRANGYADTLKNREVLCGEAARTFTHLGTAIIISDDPIPEVE